MSKIILSIDDSKMVHMVIARALKPFDVELLTAVNGAEGLERAALSRPDMIVLDATMPVMDGIEALTKLKANPVTKNIPVVMLSADGGAENKERATSLGALRFLCKPFTGDGLVACLSEYIKLAPKP